MQVFTEDARVIAVDEANVTNMRNASAGRLVVDRASFTVLDQEVWIDEDQPAAEITFAEDLRLEGHLETRTYEGEGQIEGSNLTLHAERAPIFTFASLSRVSVPEGPPGQATAIGIRGGNATPAPLEIDDEGIPAPWEAWFTELEARLPADRGEPVRIEGGLVQVVRENSPRFSCRLVLTDADDPSHLGAIHVEGQGTSFNTTLVLETAEGQDTTRTLDFLDGASTRPLHGQLVPGQSYPVEPPVDGRVERWDVRAPNCAVDDRRAAGT